MFGIIRSSSAADSKEVGGRRNGLEIKPSQDGCAGRVEDFVGKRARAMRWVKEQVYQLLRNSGMVRVESMGRCGREYGPVLLKAEDPYLIQGAF